MTKIKYNLLHGAFIVILITLIVLRLALPDQSYSWINATNYIGFVIAVISLFFEFHGEYGQSKKSYRITGIFVFLLTILIIIGVLIFTEILVPTTKVNDSIMLLTLLISLPSQFYVQLLGLYVKNEVI